MADQERNREEDNKEAAGGSNDTYGEDYKRSREAWKRYLAGEITATELERLVKGDVKEDLWKNQVTQSD